MQTSTFPNFWSITIYKSSVYSNIMIKINCKFYHYVYNPLLAGWVRLSKVNAIGFRLRTLGVWEIVGSATPAFPRIGFGNEPKSNEVCRSARLADPLFQRHGVVAETTISMLILQDLLSGINKASGNSLYLKIA